MLTLKWEDTLNYERNDTSEFDIIDSLNLSKYNYIKKWYEESKIEPNDILKQINKDDVLVFDNLNNKNQIIIDNCNNKKMLDLGQ